MNFATIIAIRNLTAIPADQKLVLYTLATRCGPKGECWPSMQTISKDTGLSKRTVQRSIKSLIEKDILSIAENRELRVSRTYKLNIIVAKEGVSHSHPGVSHSHPEVSESHGGGVTQSPGGCQPDTGGVSHSHPKYKDKYKKKEKEKEGPAFALLPADFLIKEKHYEIGKKKNMSQQMVERAHGKFLDHYTQKQNRSFDWDLMFEQWLERERVEVVNGAKDPNDLSCVETFLELLPKYVPVSEHERLFKAINAKHVNNIMYFFQQHTEHEVGEAHKFYCKYFYDLNIAKKLLLHFERGTIQ